MTVIIGIDPGLVDTGVVIMDFGTDVFVDDLLIVTFVISGTDSHPWQIATELNAIGLGPVHMFIEAYRPRGNSYSTDPKMQALLAEFRPVFPKAKVIDNTGVKQVIRRPLMEKLGVWKFSTTTHHQDLRSAARIALLGMVKDPELNQLLYDYLESRVLP